MNYSTPGESATCNPVIFKHSNLMLLVLMLTELAGHADCDNRPLNLDSDVWQDVPSITRPPAKQAETCPSLAQA